MELEDFVDDYCNIDLVANYRYKVIWNLKNLSSFLSNRILVKSRIIKEGGILEILEIKRMELNKFKMDENVCSFRLGKF